MEITVKELRRLASDVDDMHHESMRTFKEEVADLHRDLARQRPPLLPQEGRSRRRRWSPAHGRPFGSFTGLLPAAAQGMELDDMTIAGYAQSIELAAVEAYRRGRRSSPPTSRPSVELFASHHQQHADAFGAVAGDKAAAGPNQSLLDAVGPPAGGHH